MTSATFSMRILEGKANNLMYSSSDTEGLVVVWKHSNVIILTWEECPLGQQYDESTYTKDERHEFSNMDLLLEYLSANSLSIDLFVP